MSGRYQALQTSGRDVKLSLRTRGILFRTAAAVGGLFIATAICMAQEDTSGGGKRLRGRAGPRVRIEATSYIRWNRASIDPSHGASTYWLHVSAADGGGTTSGGFTIDTRPRMTGKITAITLNPAPAGPSASKRFRPPGTPLTARLIGAFSYGGSAYEIRIDVVGDLWKPASTPGGRGSSVRGSMRMKVIDSKTRAVYEAIGERQSSVTIWQR